MKVAYLCPNGFIGGAERFVLEVSDGHNKFGSFTPTIIFFNYGPAVDEAKSRGIEVIVLTQRFRLSRPLSLFKAVRELRSIFKSQDFALYNATMPYSHIVGSLASLGLKIKRTWYQHGPVAGTLDLIATLFKVEQVYFNSDYTLKTHNNSLIIRKPCFPDEVIPIGIPEKTSDKATVQSIREEFIPQGGKLILMAGRITSWKGFATGVQAFLKVKPRKPEEDVKLIIVGDITSNRDLPYKELLLKLIEGSNKDKDKEKGKGKSVLFLGRKENIGDYMAAADIFLHCSTTPEPFGLVIAEAMKQGTLVVGSSKGGTQDILIDGITGFSFDSTSEEAIENLIPVLQKALVVEGGQVAKKGKEHIDKNFSIINMTNKIESEFQKVLSNE